MVACQEGRLRLGGYRNLEVHESGDRMARKFVIDCDPGIDRALALSLALFAPEIEVVAVTAVAGTVDADQSTFNVQLVIEQTDAPRLPRVGAARQVEGVPLANGRLLHGNDGLGDCGYTTSKLHHQHPSDKLICDAVRSAPEETSILCLGPLTNIAAAFQRDPELPDLIHELIICGGTVCAPGTVAPTAEFNIFCDVASARKVLRTPLAITIVPLDVTRAVPFSIDFVERLPNAATRVGSFLRKITPHLFRSYHHHLGLEHVYLEAAVATIAALEPELFERQSWPVDVETAGELTLGQTVFDRRPRRYSPRESLVEVACSTDPEAVVRRVISGLQRAAS
ncbi:MAG TPA: nucleoside hydrolase [Planctomycetaceae bacterium]|nr:nucleoside hydrolase [Planctomycetaceae bacterium]